MTCHSGGQQTTKKAVAPNPKVTPKARYVHFFTILFRSKRYQDKQKEKKAKMLEKMSTDNDVPRHSPFKKKYSDICHATGVEEDPTVTQNI